MGTSSRYFLKLIRPVYLTVNFITCPWSATQLKTYDSSCKYLTNSMEQQSSSVEANSHSANQEIPFLLWNLKVLYSVHKTLPMVLSWARWIQSTQSHSIFLISILISSHLHLDLPSGLFPSSFPTKILYAFLISPMHACYMLHAHGYLN